VIRMSSIKSPVGPICEETKAKCRSMTRIYPPAHMALLPGGQWGLWRCVGVRGAGFPVEDVLRLGAPRCAGAADLVVNAEDRVERAAHVALEKLREIESLGSREDRARTIKVANALRTGKPLGTDRHTLAAEPQLTEYATVLSDAQAVAVAYGEAFAKARSAISAEIREVAASESFREAVLWQNRRAFHSAIEPLLRKQPGVLNKKVRQHEELVARYLQRYCMKNETIGFFGPVGWATIVPSGPAVSARPGAELISHRTVYFEGWTVDALAATVAADPCARPWLTPHPSPCVRAHDGVLYPPFEAAFSLSSGELCVWNMCDGRRTAYEVARGVLESSVFETEVQVYDVIERLRSKGVLDWTIDVPLQVNPERQLRHMIERFGDVGLREAALRRLDDLETERLAVAAAIGSQDLDRSLGHLEDAFVRATGTCPTRSAGKAYAARTVIYQDCRRNLELDLGPKILETLGPPLSLLLTSARWFTFTVSAAYRRALTDIYTAMARDASSQTVDAVRFWADAQRVLFGSRKRPLDDVLSEFQRRWAAVLRVPLQARRVQYASDELRHHVLDTFRAPTLGWTGSCYHSPDLMIAAPDVQAIERGDYDFVLGELHMAMNSLSSALFLEQHPSCEALRRAVQLDLPRGRVLPVVPKYWPKRTVRTDPALFSPDDVRLEFAPGARANDQLSVLTLHSLVVVQGPNGAVVRTSDSRLEFDVIDVFGEMLTGMLADRFKILADRPHTPRVRVDRFVICRETWRLLASDFAFAWHMDESRRFVGSRRWSRHYGLPRFIFVRTPDQPKPVYVDLESPIYVELLSKMVRHTAEVASDGVIVVTEMLPTPRDAWLPDAEGRRYSSEFRIVAVDLGACRPAAL
jgi:Lantibiotic dehydratase, N terminus